MSKKYLTLFCVVILFVVSPLADAVSPLPLQQSRLNQGSNHHQQQVASQQRNEEKSDREDLNLGLMLKSISSFVLDAVKECTQQCMGQQCKNDINVISDFLAGKVDDYGQVFESIVCITKCVVKCNFGGKCEKISEEEFKKSMGEWEGFHKKIDRSIDYLRFAGCLEPDGQADWMWKAIVFISDILMTNVCVNGSKSWDDVLKNLYLYFSLFLKYAKRMSEELDGLEKKVGGIKRIAYSARNVMHYAWSFALWPFDAYKKAREIKKAMQQFANKKVETKEAGVETDAACQVQSSAAMRVGDVKK